ncbi:MAG: ACP S-malonyltransferase [Candidatus Fermentibacteraceae bacterium]
MGRTAFLFPGQGSQKVGMDDHLRGSGAADAVLKMAEGLGHGAPLSELISQGPEDLLTRTDNVQPAITLVSLATLAVLREAGIEADAVAGHSLGEYSALAAAGVIDGADALRLTARRGELMQECASRYPGGMLALLGIGLEETGACVEKASALGPVGIANMNSPGQVVISGASEPLRKAGELCREMGARRAIPLKVSGAWHSPLMKEAAQGLGRELASTDFADPSLPLVANVTADYLESGEQAADLLRRQVVSPVLWARSMERLIEDGCDVFVEVGPGSVLQGLLRRNRDVTTYGTGTPEDLRRTLEDLRG